jgi:signal recognition particle receptor subunit beta
MGNKQSTRTVAVIGADSVGKSTIVSALNENRVVSFKKHPTLYVEANIRGKPIVRLRANALILVIHSDQSDGDLTQQQKLIFEILEQDETLPVLLYANFQDLPNAKSVAHICDKLRLHGLGNRQWYIQACCATSREGVYEGLDWLHYSINNTKAPATNTIKIGTDYQCGVRRMQGFTDCYIITIVDEEL